MYWLYCKQYPESFKQFPFYLKTINLHLKLRNIYKTMCETASLLDLLEIFEVFTLLKKFTDCIKLSTNAFWRKD